MARKGIKSTKGQGEFWDEAKTAQLKVQLTPTGKELLKQRCKALGLSQAEFLERFARGLFDVVEVASAKPPELPRPEQAVVEQTIAELVLSAIARSGNFREFASRAMIRTDELEAIAAGARPSDAALVRLARVLIKEDQQRWSSEELLQKREKQFPKVGNGHGSDGH